MHLRIGILIRNQENEINFYLNVIFYMEKTYPDTGL